MNYHKIILSFWDKYEKANYFYENILATGNEALDSRKVAFIGLFHPNKMVGQWIGIVSLFQKYGVNAQNQVMPESANSSNSRDLTNYLNKLLRKEDQAVKLRQLVAEGKQMKQRSQVEKERC